MECYITKDQQRVIHTWLHDFEITELQLMWEKTFVKELQLIEAQSAAFIVAYITYFKKKRTCPYNSFSYECIQILYNSIWLLYGFLWLLYDLC